MLKASLIRRLNGTSADVSSLAAGWSDGSLSDTSAGVTIDAVGPTATPIIQVQQTKPITIDSTMGPAAAPIIQIQQTQPITIGNGGTAEINNASSQGVIFEGATGELKLDNAQVFTGHISGLTGADAIDLADISYGANTKAFFSGNTSGGTLTVTNGTQTANIALSGNYLASSWVVSSDGHGGTVVVDPPSTLLAFPNASNTGVPAGTTLKPYTGPSTITTPNTVLSGYSFSGTITIAANNVTIENCAWNNYDGTCIQTQNMAGFTGSISGNTLTASSVSGTLAVGQYLDAGSTISGFPIGIQITGQTSGTPGGAGTYTLSGSPPTVSSGTGMSTWYGVTNVQNCTMSSGNPGTGSQAIQGAYLDITGCNISGYCKDINCEGSNVVIGGAPGLGNYLWGEASGGHSENVNINGSGTDYVVSYNTIVNSLGQTTCIFITNNFGSVDNVTINGNLIVGGGDYNIYANTTTTSPVVSNITVSNNVMSGTYGSSYGYDAGGWTPPNISNNTDMTTGRLITQIQGTGTLAPNPNIIIASFTPTNSFTIGSATFGENIATANVITLEGSTLANDPVNVYDGTTLLGTTTTNSAGVWTFTTPTLAQGVQAFTATDTKTGITSPVFDVTVGTGNAPPPPPAAPVLATDLVNSNDTVTLTGTAQANSTANLFDGSTELGTASVNASGAFSYTTAALAAGSAHTFTATDTDANGTSGNSNALNVTIASAPPPPGELVTNGSFETGSFAGWTLGGNLPSDIFITSEAESGSHAAAMGSLNSDGTLSQTLQTTAGQQYTLSFWLKNDESGSNDFAAKWNGTTLMALTNAPAQNYTEYTFTVTATGSTSTLEFDAFNTPSQWDLDNVSVTAVSSPSGPTLNSITESPSSGDLNAGKAVTLTLNLSGAVTVTGGSPTLSLNDGGTATYTSGSGSSVLTFSYTVAAGQNTASLAATAVNLNSATIKDGAGNAANLSLSGLTQTGPQIDTTTPLISSIAETPSSGVLNAGKTVTYTITTSEAVTVTGTPQLMLNDGGIATYTAGSGTSALTFKYTVLAGQNTPDLQATAVNLNGGTISDGAGNAANLSLAGIAQGSPAIDTTAPAAPVISGDTVSGNTVTLTGTAEANSAITVFDNATQLGTATTNSSGAWTYTTGALANSSQSFTATATDAAGNVSAASSALAVTLTGPQINTAPGVWYNQSFPTQTTTFTASFDATPSQLGSNIVIGLSPTTAGAYTDLAAIVRFNSSNTIDVRNGSAYGANVSVPYSAGTSYHFVMVVNLATDTYSVYVTPQGGSQIALATNYAFRTEQATDTSLSDVADYSVVGSAAVQNFSITSGPGISSLVESPSSGDLNAGKTVTLTLTMSEAVTVAGGTPTLSLNDGGTATYTSGSGSSTLTFSYTVAAGQNTAGLAATAVNLNAATIKDGAGNAANLSLSGLTQAGPQIDTTTPLISSIAETPSSGVLNAGKTVTYTITTSEAVTVTGTPQLMLNDGGIATYTAGSGTSALTFSYTVLAGQNTPDLQVTAVTLNGGTISDGAGNAANLSLAGIAQGSPAIDTTAPAAPVISGDTVSGNTVTLTGTAEANSTITVFDNATQLGTATTNSSGAWTYTTGALANSSQSFTATATDGAGNVSATSSPLNVTVNAPPNLVTNGSFETGNFTGWTRGGNLPSDIFITSEAESGSHAAAMGSLNSDGTLSQTLQTTAGQQYTLSFWLKNDESGANDFAVKWNGTTLMALTNALAQNYTEYTFTVTATGSTSTLEFDAFNTPSQWDLDNVSVTAAGRSGPTLTSITESPAGGDLNAGKAVTLTLNLSGAVTVTGGSPTLSLNDGGTATYVSGSGSNALTFSYTVGASDKNVASLSATAINLNGATITDGSGNAANLSLGGLTQAGPQIDTTTPLISSIAETPSSGVLNAGKTVTYTITTSEAVTVTGTPQLMLNDGGIATYTAGSGTSALTFKYTVLAGQNTPDLQATAVNLNGGTISDGAGNAANLSLAGIAQGSPAIDTTAPAAPVISGDTVSGNTVTLTGTAEANSTITVFDNATQLGTATTNSSGAWTYTTGALANSSQSFSATATDAAGNVSPPSSALVMTLTPTTVNLLGSQPATISNDTILEVYGPDKGSVTFTGTTGALVLNQPKTFLGKVSGFGAETEIDLPGMAFNAQSTLGYSPNGNLGGTLSVTNGTQHANIALLGSYMASSFVLEADNNGGTLVVTPTSQNGNQSLLVIPQHS